MLRCNRWLWVYAAGQSVRCPIIITSMDACARELSVCVMLLKSLREWAATGMTC